MMSYKKLITGFLVMLYEIRTVDSAFLHQYLNKKLKPLGNILLSRYDESQKLIAGFFAILYELSYKKVKQSIKWKYLRTTVVCN